MGEWRRMRWYNPSLGDFEWLEMPASDVEALKLVEGAPDRQKYVDVYQYWRGLGASVTASLIRVGEAAREAPRPTPHLNRLREEPTVSPRQFVRPRPVPRS